MMKDENNMPLVSVIIPFFNRIDWLEEAVDSVLNQSYSNYEIIVVNDGSTENIDGFLQKYKNKLKYIYQRNKGSGSARNNGICHVKGKYVAFLDSDDSLYETFGYGNNMRVDTSDYKGFIFPDCMSSCKIATPCVVIRSDILKQNTALRFNEKMRYGQDFYLWVLM